MEATVQKLSTNLGYCEAKTTNDLLIVFRLPTSPSLNVGDILALDLSELDREQTIRNVSRGFSFSAVIRADDIHDLRVAGIHGISRRRCPPA